MTKANKVASIANAREARQLKRVATTKGAAVRGGSGRGSKAGRGVRSSGRGPNGGWQRGAEVVGRLLEVYWATKKEWLEGKVDEYNKRSGKHHVTYKSGDQHWIVLGEKRLRWVIEGGGESQDVEDDDEDDHENSHNTEEGDVEEVSGSAGRGDEGSSEGGAEEEPSEGKRNADVQQQRAGKETSASAVGTNADDRGVDSSDRGRTAAHEHDASMTASPSAQDVHESDRVQNQQGKRVLAGNGKPVTSSPQLTADKQISAPNPSEQSLEGKKERGNAISSLPGQIPAGGPVSGGKLGAALSPKGHLDFSDTEVQGLHSAATPGDSKLKVQVAESGSSGQEHGPNLRKTTQTPGSSPRPRQAKKVSPGSARNGAASQSNIKPATLASGSGQNGNRSLGAAVPASPRTRSAAEAQSAQQDTAMPDVVTVPRQPEGAPPSSSGHEDSTRHEAARAEANAAWQRAQEMADKAVRLVKLAQEGTVGEKANNGMDIVDEKSGSKPPASDKGLPTASGRKHSSLRRKQQTTSSGGRQGASSGLDAAVRARVSVFWPGDQVYYKGRITDYNKDKGMYCIRYDDSEEEWLNLSEEYFKWLGPRARSAGYSPALATAIMKLGPEGITPPSVATLAERTREADVNGPRGEAAVGYRMGLLWEADGRFHYGEVLAYNEHKHKHHILFDDGEDEWVQLTKEAKVWRHKGRGASLPAGLAQGEDAPRGRSAIGWRIGVYWKEDTVFYEGEIKGYDSATGKHHILYDDTEDEYISLSTEKIKWMVPPSTSTEKKSGPGRRHRSAYGRPGKKMSLNAIHGVAPGAYAPLSSSKPTAWQAVRSDGATSGQGAGDTATGVATSSSQPTLREGAVSRQARRSAVQESAGKDVRASDYMCVSIVGPLRRGGGAAGPSGGEGCKEDALHCRLAIVERMLARVVAAQEAVKLGLPAGAQPCKGCVHTNMPPPPAGLRKIKTASVCKVHETAPAAPHPTAAAPSGSSPKCPTPTAFHLDIPVSPFAEAASPGGLLGPSPSTVGRDAGPVGGSQRGNMMSVSPSPLKPALTPATAGRGAKVRPGVTSSSMPEAPPSKARRLDMEAPHVSGMMAMPGHTVPATAAESHEALPDSSNGGQHGAARY